MSITKKSLKIHNLDKIVGSEVKHRATKPIHWSLTSQITHVGETDDLYIFYTTTEYDNMVGLGEIHLSRDGEWFDEVLMGMTMWKISEGSGKKLYIQKKDIEDPKILLKRMRQLLEIGV